MDLSKAFDRIPHDLLIAKLNAYGLEFRHGTFLNSYLKDSKQNVRIDMIYSAFLNILSGVPQGSILGPTLFIMFLNDLFLCFKMTDLYKFVDDNTIATTCSSLKELLRILEQKSESAVRWFKQTEMIVNANKFQDIILIKKKVKINIS